MANIKLTELAKQFEDKTPTAVNKLPDLAEKMATKYSDVHLDLIVINDNNEGDRTLNGAYLYKDDSINSDVNIKDIKSDTNVDAIINSVRNWLKTTKYSRLLDPDISIDLRQYLFEAVDEYTAYFIGMDIIKYLPFYEPRVEVESCEIKVDVDNGLFEINLQLVIPELNNKPITFTEILGGDNFITY